MPDLQIAEASGAVYRLEQPYRRKGEVNWMAMRNALGAEAWRQYIDFRRFLREYGIKA